jgi:hypothetical protein
VNLLELSSPPGENEKLFKQLGPPIQPSRVYGFCFFGALFIPTLENSQPYYNGAFILAFKSVLIENLGGILGGA